MAQERRGRQRKPFRQHRRKRERVHALGVDMDLVRPEEVMHQVSSAIAAGDPYCVANYNLHGIYLGRKNAGYAKFCRDADLIEVDSTPIIAFTRMLGLHAKAFHRCTYLDWREHFWSLADREGWRVFYLGGEPGVAEAAKTNLSSAYPNAKIAVRHGFFDANLGSADNAEILAQIAAFEPQVLFVGMGMPRQEIWLSEHAKHLPPCVTFSVGAAFDYEAGVQQAAPRWMGRVGIEWLYRLAHDPRRLFARYCIEPWVLLPVIMSDIYVALRAGRLFSTPVAPPRGFVPRGEVRPVELSRLAD